MPIAFGNAAGWLAFHTSSGLANNMIPAERLQAMIAGEKSGTAPR